MSLADVDSTKLSISTDGTTYNQLTKATAVPELDRTRSVNKTQKKYVGMAAQPQSVKLGDPEVSSIALTMDKDDTDAQQTTLSAAVGAGSTIYLKIEIAHDSAESKVVQCYVVAEKLAFPDGADVQVTYTLEPFTDVTTS